MTRDKLIEVMAREHDREEAAMIGEPSPWIESGDFDDFRKDRISCMSTALTDLEQAGFVVVPREPTDAMIKASIYAVTPDKDGNMPKCSRKKKHRLRYSAMITADEGET